MRSFIVPGAIITGLDKDPLPYRELAMEAGYAILDTKADRLCVFTVRSNRQDAWNAFCKAEMRREWQRRGFKCVPVVIKQYDR